MNFDTLIVSKEEKGVSLPPVMIKKLCPFRKHTIFKKNGVKVQRQYATDTEEEFLPCIQSDCMFYNLYAPGGPVCTKN